MKRSIEIFAVMVIVIFTLFIYFGNQAYVKSEMINGRLGNDIGQISNVHDLLEVYKQNVGRFPGSLDELNEIAKKNEEESILKFHDVVSGKDSAILYYPSGLVAPAGDILLAMPIVYNSANSVLPPAKGDCRLVVYMSGKIDLIPNAEFEKALALAHAATKQ